MFAGKDRSFFEEKILIHYEAIFKYALAMTKNDHAAEDIAQGTIEKAWTHLSQLRDREKTKAWVFEIARNEIKHHFRDTRKWYKEYDAISDKGLDLEFHDDPEETFFEKLTMEEEKALLARAMEELPIKYREVLILWSQGEMSEKELSQVMDINYNTIRVHIHRGLKRLKEIYFSLEGGAQGE